MRSRQKTAKKLSKKIIFAIVCAAIIATILISCAGLQISFALAHSSMCWRPDYEMEDLGATLEKDALSDEDYDFLYRQTGLTRIGIDRMLEKGNAGRNRILRIQADYFAEHKISEEDYAPLICTDFIDSFVTHSYLKDGDVIVTSSTHFSGWRMGHAGLVVNGDSSEVLQASTYGDTSFIGSINDFTDRINFMILSPKVDDGTKAQVVEYAKSNLIGKHYDITVGVLTDKNKVERTQCAHLVWYAYNAFGIDLDFNGGMVVTPHDLVASPYMELVQVFGLDPEKLW